VELKLVDSGFGSGSIGGNGGGNLRRDEMWFLTGKKERRQRHEVEKCMTNEACRWEGMEYKSGMSR
jgi:hypothetical protein